MYEDTETGKELYRETDPTLYPNKGDTVVITGYFYSVVKVIIIPQYQTVTVLVKKG